MIITQAEVKRINELYLKLKTYAAVARELGISPGTVKKYVIDGYSKVDESKVIRYEGNTLPRLELSRFRGEDWGKLCMLSPEEEEEIKVLWEEIEI